LQQLQKLEMDELFKDVPIIRPSSSEKMSLYAKRLAENRKRKGVTPSDARELIRHNNYFGPMMVEMGDADAVLNGVAQSYPDCVRPAMHSIGVLKGSRLVGVYLVILKKRILWFADTTINIAPTASELCDIAIQTAQFASQFMAEVPKIAMLSFSNFGSNNHAYAEKVRTAADLVKESRPDWIIDGEMQVDTALNPAISFTSFPFNKVPGDANILIFPDLQSANIAYKLIGNLSQAELIGPILLGMKKPAYVLAQNSTVTEVVNMCTLVALNLQRKTQDKTETPHDFLRNPNS